MNIFIPFPLALISICMQCSGGLLYQREEHNILQVCLVLWHLNKLERCINLAKDWGQSDGWTGIISYFSCSVFIAINFKQGNRLQGVCCIRKEVCILLWLLGILVQPSSTSLAEWTERAKFRRLLVVLHVFGQLKDRLFFFFFKWVPITIAWLFVTFF